MQGGDLARRVTHRRTELGLSTEELAKQAGIDAWFLAYFEQSTDGTLTGGALLRLAVALDTTPLLSKVVGSIARRARAAPGRIPLSRASPPAQCEAHLAAGGIGRIVLSTGSGPVAYPVNFVFARRCVIFRTSDAMVANITGVVAFEVDHVDEAMSEGWSVLVRGHARLIEDPEVRLAAAATRSRALGRRRTAQRGQHRTLRDHRPGHRPAPPPTDTPHASWASTTIAPRERRTS